MDVKISDFKVICRVCLKRSEQPVSISSCQIIQMMTTCTSVQIWNDDELPNQLCENCLLILQNSYSFKQLAEKSDKNLRQIYENHNFDDQKPDFDDEIDSDSIKNEPNDDDGYTPDVEIKYEYDDPVKDDDESDEKKLEYQCEECDFTCENVHHLSMHMKRLHQKKGEACNKCNTLFYHSLELKRHEESQSCGKSKLCSICKKDFKTKSSLIRHSIVVHGTEKPHKCSQCDRSFKLYSSLKLHVRSAHKRSDDKRTPCDVCGKRILKGEIKRHAQIHENVRETIPCPHCEKKFLHQCSLKLHIKQFHGDGPPESEHLCTICGKKFRTRRNLDRHGSVHRSERPFECQHCGKTFKWDHNLKGHINMVHLKVKVDNRIPCKVCGKLIKKTNMDLHLQIHKDVRDTYTCTQCNKQFLHQLSLEQHIKKLHEKVAREYRHLCNMCGKGFTTRAELKTHMLSHSDEKTFECQTCDMKYKTMHGLRYHVKSVHLNLKQYPCPVCSRHFSTRGVVERHMRTHTGERPFVCKLCEKSFNQKSTLTTHMRLVHATGVAVSNIDIGMHSKT